MRVHFLAYTTNAFEKTASVQTNFEPIKSFSGEYFDRVGISLDPVSMIYLYACFVPIFFSFSIAFERFTLSIRYLERPTHATRHFQSAEEFRPEISHKTSTFACRYGPFSV